MADFVIWQNGSRNFKESHQSEKSKFLIDFELGIPLQELIFSIQCYGFYFLWKMWIEAWFAEVLCSPGLIYYNECNIPFEWVSMWQLVRKLVQAGSAVRALLLGEGYARCIISPFSLSNLVDYLLQTKGISLFYRHFQDFDEIEIAIWWHVLLS